MSLRPIYLAESVSFAFQLRWSLSLFSHRRLPDPSEWYHELADRVAADQVRLLDVRLADDVVTQFLISTPPSVAPPDIVKSVKGRLQNLVHHTHSECFRRNFRLTSVGDPGCRQVINYVANQVEHHLSDYRLPMLDLNPFQLSYPYVDLSRPQFTAHGSYLYALHLVVEFARHAKLFDQDEFLFVRDMLVRASAKHRHRLARGGILPDHLHMALGPCFTWSPEQVALSYMNNVAYALGMNAVLRPSAYVGTFGPYNMRAIRRGGF